MKTCPIKFSPMGAVDLQAPATHKRHLHPGHHHHFHPWHRISFVLEHCRQCPCHSHPTSNAICLRATHVHSRHKCHSLGHTFPSNNAYVRNGLSLQLYGLLEWD
ncbi:hypothetical protein O6H91_19G018600 [Diphasiastrum complanatum]|uniref:Uncharacterized protein n=1 Tax=Diphasiastrum complanatum TaxID=34168 RepID=A0ACC2AT49_DIPCM|nr:hypothetical protein O6H91_19G018600 [Diphasiastrum complanatum]